MKCEICGMENAKLRVKDLYYHKKCLLEHGEKSEISEIRLVCRSCKYEQIVKKSKLKQCPQCGSSLISYFSSGTRVRKMRGSKYIALIGAILGILTVVLFYLLPEMFYLWGIKATGTENLRFYLGGFYSVGYTFSPLGLLDIEFIQTLEPILFIVSVLITGGFVITLIGSLEGKRSTGIGGGITLLLGPVLLMIALLTGMGTLFGELASILGLIGQNLLFGSLSSMGTTMSWGLGSGFFVALAGGVLGVIGGALMERK